MALKRTRRDLIMPAESIVENNRRRNNPSILQFPTDLGPHAIVLGFKKHSFAIDDPVSDTVISPFKTAPEGSLQTSPLGSVVLPLPTNLEDTFVVQLNPSTNLGITGSIIAQYADLALTRGVEALTEREGMSDTEKAAMRAVRAVIEGGDDASVGQIMSSIAEVGIGSIGTAARAAIRKVPSVSTPFDLGIGQTVNPHVALTFEGINLKRHNFQWTFSPGSRADSDALRNIATFIRRNVLPEYGPAVNFSSIGETPSAVPTEVLEHGGAFNDRIMLKYPSVVDIFFVGLDQSYYYYFKRCMVDNFGVNYNPTGQHTILQGGRPAFATMFMSLVETEIHTADDYGDESTPFVGLGPESGEDA